MQIKTITYQRVKNLGSYESERMEMTLELNDDDDVENAIKGIKLQVKKALNLPVDEKVDDSDIPW